MMKLYDAHTHLNHEELFQNWEILLDEFSQIGGAGLVNIGANRHYNDRGILIAHQAKDIYPKVWVKASVGMHPCDVQNLSGTIDDEIDFLKAQISQNRGVIVAIGECGIDLYYPGASDYFDLQKDYFEKQCDLARQLNLPIVIHSRAAFDETFEILKHYKDLKIYFHCWSYGLEELEILLATFPKLWIGYTGMLTYPKSESIRQCLRKTPLSQLLLETDAPYLAPQGFRGQINSPALVRIVGEYASEILDMEGEKLWIQVGDNMRSLYGDFE